MKTLAGWEKVPLPDYFRLVNHGPVVLISTGDGRRANVAPIAWNVPVSDDPPLFAIAVERDNFTHALIRKTGAFTVNVPHAGQLRAVQFCGRNSGRQGDKFRAGGLTPEKGLRIKAPRVRGCVAFFECRVEKTVRAGGQSVFIGRVLSAYVRRGFFPKMVLSPRARTFHHMGRGVFALTGRRVKV